MNDDLVEMTAEAQRAAFVEDFKNYGMLLDTMTPEEFSREIGQAFQFTPKQAAIVVVLLGRIMALEMRLA